MGKIWRQNGKLIRSGGRVVRCDDCPCDGGIDPGPPRCLAACEPDAFSVWMLQAGGSCSVTPDAPTPTGLFALDWFGDEDNCYWWYPSPSLMPLDDPIYPYFTWELLVLPSLSFTSVLLEARIGLRLDTFAACGLATFRLNITHYPIDCQTSYVLPRVNWNTLCHHKCQWNTFPSPDWTPPTSVTIFPP